MMHKALHFLFWIPILCFSQPYPQTDFIPPVDIPLALSGTFGELRGNHFHAGLDIKTQGREGLVVRAAADGQIVRVKVSAYGYGNAIYLAHPNGYTTVYGHLQQFTPEVAEWVKQQQYACKSFEVDLFPPGGKFTFKQGDEIAKSGNSGGSGGPHLHFEIRDSKTEKTINPALFGLPIKDNRAPVILHIYAQPLSADAAINGRHATQEIPLTALGNNTFQGAFRGSGVFGLTVHTFDQQDLSNNHNGIYQIEQFVNDTLTYQFTIDQFAFSQTRYINAHMDFARYKTSRQLAHHCFVLPGNKLPNYSSLINQGYIDLTPPQVKNIKLVITDSWGNKSIILLAATGELSDGTIEEQTHKLQWDTANTIKIDGVKVYLPKGTLYQDQAIAIVEKPACAQCESNVYEVGENTIPAQNRFDLSIHRSQLQNTDKLVWAEVNANGSGSGLTTKWNGDWLTARPRAFGQYAVMMDTQPPTVTVLNFSSQKAVTKGAKIGFKATDDLSGITFYEAKIDNQWVLLQHDAKRHYFWYNFEGDLSAGAHEIVVTFKDEVGNTKTYNTVFTYQP